MTGRTLCCAALLTAAWAAFAPPPAAAQPTRVGPLTQPTVAAEELRLHAFTLRHQRAIEALALVEPLLSARGTVELQAGTNTLVVRDTLASLTRVIAALRAFDHAAQPVAFDLQLIQAERGGISPVPKSPPLDPLLERRLTQILRYQSLRLLARARLDSREGERVDYEVAGSYRVSFELGTLIDDRRIKLHRFRVTRDDAGAESDLIQTAVNVWRGQPLILGLTRDETSPSALIVVVTLLPAAEPR